MSERIVSLAREMHAAGTSLAFGVVGSGASLDLVVELENLGVRYVPASHEGAAAMMAGAASRVLDAPSVSIGVRGPGLASMIPGIASNHFECHPVFSATEALGVEAASQMHKRLDHPGLVTPLVKASGALDPSVPFESLLSFARKEIPGPIHLDLVEGSFHLNDRPDDEIHPSNDGWRATLKGSVRPLVIAGSWALRAGLGPDLATLKVPVLTTVAAKGLMDEAHPYSAGVFTGAGRELAPETTLLDACDLVVGIGLRTRELLSPTPFDRPFVAFDAVTGKAPGGSTVEAFTGVESTAVVDALAEHEWGGDEIARLRGALDRHLLSSGWLPARCFDVLDSNDWAYGLVADTGSFCTIAEHLWRASPDRPFLASANGRFMGTALPTAIGASLADPARTWVCAVGDGGIRSYVSEWRIAVRYGLPICLILFSDGRYGSVASVRRGRSTSDAALEVPGRSWVEAMEGFGCQARSVAGEEELTGVLEGWQRSQPLFVEANFAADEYAAMTDGIR